MRTGPGRLVLALIVGLAAVGTARGGQVQHVEPTTLRKVVGTFLAGPSWSAWHAIIAATFACPPHAPEETEVFTRCTGRSWPDTPARELFVVAGRGSGKSRVVSVLALSAACFRTYGPLAPGERIYVGVFAPDRRQAAVTFRYVTGLLHSVRALERLIVTETRHSVELSSGVIVEVITASLAAPRGRAYALAIVEEAAFLPVDLAANPDTELLPAVRPALARVAGSMLAVVSSPYSRKGELWRNYQQHFGKDGDPVVVVVGDTLTLNPTFDAREIERAYADDPVAAAAEYGAQFRSDVESFISREALDACVVPGRLELPPVSGVSYRAFLDFAGGSGGDSATLAIAHAETRGDHVVAVLDLVREVRPRFSPDQVCVDFAATMRPYAVSATADRSGGQFPVERMAKLGVRVEPSEKVKSDLYREFLPLLNSGRVELLDHPRLLAQLASLERRTARGGRESIDGPPGPNSHDDLANSCAGSVLAVSHVSPAACGRFSDPGESPGSELAARVRAMSQARLTARSARLWRE